MDLGLIPAAVDALLNALKRFDDKKDRQRGDRESRSKAIDSVLRAALETKAYQRDRADLKRVDRERELKLSMLWQSASTAMQEHDHALWEICGFKALGWADSSEWAKATVGPEKIKLDKIIEQCRHLQKAPT
jgi:hypothetical protein